MNDARERAAEVLGDALGSSYSPAVLRLLVRRLDAAGLLVTPEHDRQVAAQALREWLATWPNRYVGSPIYEDGMTYADRIERGDQS